MARLELPVESIAEFCQGETRRAIVEELKQLGFRFIAIDLEGFRSGSLNDLLPPESLVQLSLPEA